MSFPLTNNLSSLPKLREGVTLTVAEFYERYVAPHLPSPAAVQHWHQLLVSYVKQPQAILMIRRYHNWETGRKNESLRRGFLSLDPTGFGYVFGDNVLPQFVAAWVMAGELPTLEEWSAAMTGHTMPLVGARFVTQAERKYNLFALAPTILGNKGWKLAHLHSVNGTYAKLHFRTHIKEVLPRGEYEDWAGADHIRHLKQAITPADRALLTAHFLRAVHPLNYFLSPGTSHQATRPDIGEATAVQEYVRYQFGQLYGEQMLTEFEQLLLLEPQPPIATGQSAGDIQLGLTVEWNARKNRPPSASAEGSEKLPAQKRVLQPRSVGFNSVDSFKDMTVAEVWERVRKEPLVEGELKIGAALQIIMQKLDNDKAGIASLRAKIDAGNRLGMGNELTVFRTYTTPEEMAARRRDALGRLRYYAPPLAKHGLLFCSQWNYKGHSAEWTRLFKEAGLL